jgi:hypothetical protein
MKTALTTEVVCVRLAELEGVIERGLQTFVEVGKALLEIRDSRLYLEACDKAGKPYGTFEDYCRERWGMSRIHAFRLIQATEVTENLLPMGNIPTNERVARELVGLPVDEQREVWTQAIENSKSGQPTAQEVRLVVRELRTAKLSPAVMPAGTYRVLYAVRHGGMATNLISQGIRFRQSSTTPPCLWPSSRPWNCRAFATMRCFLCGRLYRYSRTRLS